MKRLLVVARAVARRNLIHAFKNPALLLPSILFPLIFLIANAGGLSSLSKVPGFDFRSGYTAFQFVFVFLQSAAFGGIFSGFAIASDGESGFNRRLLLAAPRREGIVLGYVASGIVRFLVGSAFITVVSLLAGMQVDGSGIDLLGLLVLGILVNTTATLWSAGFFLRFQSLQAGPFVQIPVFIGLFLAPVFVPLPLLSGWIHAVAKLNPATAFLEAGRGFISGVNASTGIAFLCAVALVALFAAWALTGLRRAERMAD